MDAQYSADTGSCGRAGRGGATDLGPRDTGHAVLAPVDGRPTERHAADAGHRAAIHAGGIDQRDEFCDPVGVTGGVSALDGSQDCTSGDDELVPDRNVRVDSVVSRLHDEQRGDDRQHNRDRGQSDDPGARGRGDGDHVWDDVCQCGRHDDAIRTGRVMRTARVIRPATREDVPALVAMGQQFAQTEMYRDVLHENPEQMAVVATNLIENEGGTVMVLERDGVLVGMIGLVCTPHFLSGDMYAGEVFWWVTPGQRGDGVRLLRSAEAWAIERGAKTLQMIAPTERVGQFYARMGFTRTDISYQKDLGT